MNNISRRLKAAYLHFATNLQLFKAYQGWWGSREVAGSSRVKHFQGNVASTDAQLHSKYHKK